MLDESKPKVYGLNKINVNQTIYITEGPFDSFFIENSVAMCGADVNLRTYNWGDWVYVYDNEPRNTEIINRISNAIDRGDKVVIWPNVPEKDINDMFLARRNVKSLIELNTYQGLEAKVKLTEWKKV